MEIARELINPIFAPLAEAHLEDVLVHRIGGGELALDAIQPGRQLYGEGQVRVRRWIGHSQLAARADAAAVGDADQRGSVAHRPRHVGRSLVTRDQSLVAVYERIRDRAEAAGMLQ